MADLEPIVICAGTCGRALHPDNRYLYREIVALEHGASKRMTRKTYTGRYYCPDCANPPVATQQISLEGV